MAEKTALFDLMGAIQESKFTMYFHLHMCNPEKQKEFSCSSIIPLCCDPLYKYGKKCKIKRYFLIIK